MKLITNEYHYIYIYVECISALCHTIQIFHGEANKITYFFELCSNLFFEFEIYPVLKPIKHVIVAIKIVNWNLHLLLM